MTNHRTSAPAPRLFLLEFAVVAVIFWADWAGYIPLSKTIPLFFVAWIFMALRRVTWRSVGFEFPPSWVKLIALGVIAGVAMFTFEFFVVQNAIKSATGELPDLHEFDALVGNWKLLVLLLAFNLVLAAFGEEMVWRGYALPRVAAVLGGGKSAWIMSLAIVNLGFGLAHLYQGLPGVIETTIAGVFLGVLYLATNRNLLASMAAHFTSNTIDFTVIYLGLYPGVGQ